VAKHLPQWKVMPMEGTYLAWVKIEGCENVEAYCDELVKKAKVWLNPGTMYGPESGKGYIRINLACPRALLMEALERIKDNQ
jgi:cystathionine beta-lyase